MTKRTYVANNKKHNGINQQESLATESGYLKRSKVDRMLLYDGFEAAQNVFQTGTEEVRQLLLHECTLIFECQFCRNLFRSVNDFLNHKRNVCQIITTKYKPEQKTKTVNTQTDNEMNSVGTCTSPVALNEMSQQNGDDQANFVNKYPELHNLLFPKESEEFEKHTNNDKTESFTDNEQNYVNSAVVAPALDGTVHIARCRLSATYVFQCPQCPMVFEQPAAAMKHMMKTHNRPRLGLRMLREAILKRRIQVLSEESESLDTREDNCHCAYCKEVFQHSVDLSIHLLYCSVKDIVLQRRRVHFRHHSADYIRTAIEESKREHLDPTIPLDFSDLWPISRQKLTKARLKIKQMEAKHSELKKKGTGANEIITVEGGGVNATLLQADVAQTNGFVHIIDKVLGVPYTTVLGKLESDPMMSGTYNMGQFSSFNDQLNNTQRRFTYFVPRDKGWQKTELDYPSAHKKLFMRDFAYHSRSILERHLVIADRVFTMKDLVAMTRESDSIVLPSFRDSLKIKVEEESGRYVIVWNFKKINVYRPDVECTNGIIHVIDYPLLEEKDIVVSGGSYLSLTHYSNLLFANIIMIVIAKMLHY